MKISKVTKNDGVQMAKIIALLQFAKQIKEGLATGGIDIEGPQFSESGEALKWLNELSKDMATQLAPKK